MRSVVHNLLHTSEWTELIKVLWMKMKIKIMFTCKYEMNVALLSLHKNVEIYKEIYVNIQTHVQVY